MPVRLMIAAGVVLALLGTGWWIRDQRARQHAAEAAATVYQDRILRMRQAKERRDEATRLDDDGLLDALGRWIVPGAGHP